MTPPSRKALAGYQRRHLRKLAHGKRPIITVGEAGISDSVLSALDQALIDHELVKVKLPGAEGKKELGAELAARSGAHLCGLVGHMAILFRPDPETPRIELPTRMGS
jgi:RNA-binding protein